MRVTPLSFFPPLSNYGYATENYSWLRSTGFEGELLAPLSLPSGARIVSIKFEFLDFDDSQAIKMRLLSCLALTENCVFHPEAGAGPPDCAIPGRICSGEDFAGGFSSVTADLSPDDLTVDNLNRVYVLKIENDPPSAGLKLAGVVVGYVLQVSPAPTTATFNDVPTGHPFFQFVEALAASGITAGCGGGDFCPNAPLTRGQMAVFLAKALGLQWP